MNSEQITAFLQEHWYIATVMIGVVILIGAIRNWNWICDPTGTRDAHRHSRGYRRVVFFLLGGTISYGFPACCSIEELRERMDREHIRVFVIDSSLGLCGFVLAQEVELQCP